MCVLIEQICVLSVPNNLLYYPRQKVYIMQRERGSMHILNALNNFVQIKILGKCMCNQRSILCTTIELETSNMTRGKIINHEIINFTISRFSDI